jgi:hypothetical protein
MGRGLGSECGLTRSNESYRQTRRMHKFAGSCTPEQLHTLQTIFDLIWMKLQETSASRYDGPTDPNALRDEIARRVLGQFDGGDPDAETVTRHVLASFERRAPHRASVRGNGATKDRNKPDLR